MPFEIIASFQNPRIRLAQKLHDKASRDRENAFVVDDGRDLARALACGYAVRYALYAPEVATAEDAHLITQIPAQYVYQVAPALLAKASYRENPGGIVAVLAQKPARTDLSTITAQHVLGLVNLRKPGNIGALLRTADAAGFAAVVLIDTALDLYNPNIIRTSTGACFLGNIYTASTQQALDAFRAAGYAILAGHPDGTASLFTTAMRTKLVIILGTEDTGLDATWLAASSHLIKIPMIGAIADSLNVSVSGAVLMYEALRQRLHG